MSTKHYAGYVEAHQGLYLTFKQIAMILSANGQKMTRQAVEAAHNRAIEKIRLWLALPVDDLKRLAKRQHHASGKSEQHPIAS
jgi:hypothetical protein